MHRTVDITTTGRRSGQPRRIEIWMYEVDGTRYISGSPGTRGWYANLLSTPEFTLHLKDGEPEDLPVRARPVTDPGQRRAILERFASELGKLEAMVQGAPLVEVSPRG